MRTPAFVVVILCALLHGIPWLLDAWPVMLLGWLGIACGMWLATSSAPWNRLWCLWIWGSLSIGIAFHWSPAAMTYTLSSDYWLGFLVALPLIAWDGLRLALGYWLGARLCQNRRLIWLSTAICTILLEEFMPGVFPWRLGMMQLPWPWWLQAVDIFGAGWSTMIAFALAGLILNVAMELPRSAELCSKVSSDGRTTARWPLAVAPSLLLANAIYCGWSWQAWQSEIADASKVRVGLVQVDPSHKVSTQQLQALTQEISDDVQLVCWPESTAGTYDLRLKELSNADRNFQLSRDPERGLRPWPNPSCELLLAGKNYQQLPTSPVKKVRLTGRADVNDVPTVAVAGSVDGTDAFDAVDDAEPERLYVSAMLLDDHERIVARYHKRYLMPFGEYVPGENIVPGMAELFDMCEHVTPGDGTAVLKSQTGARLGVMLCYEDMVPQAASSAVRQRANVIVSLINGSAFASPVTLHQHRLLSHLRALESRRTFVRCAATGETCVISARGEIQARLPMQANAAMKSDIALLDGRTVYSQSPHLLLALLVPCLVVFLWKRHGT